MSAVIAGGFVVDDNAYYHGHMKALLHRIAPRLGLLVVLAAAVGCLFFLFELFVGLTPSGGNDLSPESSSLGPGFEVPQRRFSNDRARGGHLHCAWSRSSPALAAMAEGSSENTTLGHGLWRSAGSGDGGPWDLLARFGDDAQKPSLRERPLRELPSERRGMEPLGVTVLATVVLAVVLIGVTKPRLLILLLAVCLVSILMFGLPLSSPIRGPSLFGHPSQLQLSAGYAEEVNALHQRGPATVGSSGPPGTGAVEHPVGDSGSGDSRTEEADGTGGLSSWTPGAASADDHPPQPVPAVRDTSTEATEAGFHGSQGRKDHPGGDALPLSGTLTGADGEAPAGHASDHQCRRKA